MKLNEKHTRKIGTIPIKDANQAEFTIEMRNDSLLLFNKLANIMTILIDLGSSSSIIEQRKISDMIAREILGEQYKDFTTNYQKTYGKKWHSYIGEENPSVKNSIAEYKAPVNKVPEDKVPENKASKTKVEPKVESKKVNLLGEPIDVK